MKPPWGTLNAIDLDKGTIAWRVTLGEFPELTKRGIAPTGTENYGGPAVTAGGLVFIGAKMGAAEFVGKIGPEISLPVIALILGTGVAASLVRSSRTPTHATSSAL